jgi:hypothetical protein
MKICPLEAELIHADGRTDGQIDTRTDTTKANRRFWQFSEGA